MPEANLTDLEREDISLYLATFKTESEKSPATAKGNATRGAKLISQHRCAACHNLPDKLNSQALNKSNLDAQSRWDAGCLQSAQSTRRYQGWVDGSPTQCAQSLLDFVGQVANKKRLPVRRDADGREQLLWLSCST